MSKLDKNLPYGTIYGHEFAAFEQDGKLFDGAGNLANPPDPEPDEAEEQTPEEFVQEILAGGPVSQANVYKEVGIRGLDWAAVKEASVSLGVKIADVKGVSTWDLKQ